MEIAGRTLADSSKIGHIPIFKRGKYGSQKLVETCDDSELFLNFVTCRPEAYNGGEIDESSCSGSQKNTRNKEGNKGDIETLLILHKK